MARLSRADRHAYERQLADAMADTTARLARKVADHLRSRHLSASADMPDTWWDDATAMDEAEADLHPVIQAAAKGSATAVATKLGAHPFHGSPDLDAFTKDRARTAARTMTDTVRSDIDRRIADASDDEDAADALDTYAAETKRPWTVAAMEIATAIAWGAVAGGKQAAEQVGDGQVAIKTWVLNPDHGDPDDCDEMNGLTDAIDGDFNGIGDAPLHFGCGCDTDVELVPESESLTAAAASETWQTWRVTERDIGEHGFCCVECGKAFDLGDLYATVALTDAVDEVVCLDCAASTIEAPEEAAMPEFLEAAGGRSAPPSPMYDLPDQMPLKERLEREGVIRARRGPITFPHASDASTPPTQVTFPAAQMAALTAALERRGATLDLGSLTAAPDGSVTVTQGGNWHAVATVEGWTTTDGREFAPNSVKTRALPLPFMSLTETSMGHEKARLAGAITEAERDGDLIINRGFFDVGDVGVETQRLVENQVLRWVSVDVEVIDYELVIDDEDDLWDLLFWQGDNRRAAQSGGITERYLDANEIGLTACPFPAFPQAVITMASVPLPDASAEGAAAAQALQSASPQPLLVASAAGAWWWDSAEHPPESWFQAPALAGKTHLTVTDEGRIYGHLATWDQRHVGYQDRAVHAPKSRSAYAYFRTGVTKAAAGADDTIDVLTGPITMGTGHADRLMGHHAATAHYDDTGQAVADIACGEDEFGIWVAGAVRPTATPEQIAVLRASDISGDWRDIGGGLELIGALLVNAPGFPVPRSLAASAAEIWPDQGRTRVGFHDGRMVSLVAAGVVHNDAWEAIAELRRSVADLRSIVEPLAPLARRELVSRAIKMTTVAGT